MVMTMQITSAPTTASTVANGESQLENNGHKLIKRRCSRPAETVVDHVYKWKEALGALSSDQEGATWLAPYGQTDSSHFHTGYCRLQIEMALRDTVKLIFSIPIPLMEPGQDRTPIAEAAAEESKPMHL